MRERSEIENQINEVRQNYGVRLNYENLLKELQIELLLDVRELLNNNQSLQQVQNGEGRSAQEFIEELKENLESKPEPSTSKEPKKVLNKELEKDRKNRTSKKGSKKK